MVEGCVFLLPAEGPFSARVRDFCVNSESIPARVSRPGGARDEQRLFLRVRHGCRAVSELIVLLFLLFFGWSSDEHPVAARAEKKCAERAIRTSLSAHSRTNA